MYLHTRYYVVSRSVQHVAPIFAFRHMLMKLTGLQTLTQLSPIDVANDCTSRNLHYIAKHTDTSSDPTGPDWQRMQYDPSIISPVSHKPTRVTCFDRPRDAPPARMSSG